MEKETKAPFGRPFQPGQSGNPGGIPKVAPFIKKFRRVSYEEFVDHLQTLGSMSRDEFYQAVTDPSQSMFQSMTAKLLEQAVRGDRYARTEILERLWGKVKEVHEIRPPEHMDEKLKGLSPEKQEQLIELLSEASKNEANG